MDGLFLAQETLCVLVTQMSRTVGQEWVVVGEIGEERLEGTILENQILQRLELVFVSVGCFQVQVSVF